MPRFFFDTQEGGVHTPDVDGVELSGRHLVAKEARRLLLDVTRDLKIADERFLIEVSVRDDDGAAVHWSSLLLEAKSFGT